MLADFREPVDVFFEFALGDVDEMRGVSVEDKVREVDGGRGEAIRGMAGAGFVRIWRFVIEIRHGERGFGVGGRLVFAFFEHRG